MPVSVHAVQTESVVSYEEDLAPPLPTSLVYNPILMPDATIHNGAVAVNMFDGLSMSAFLTAASGGKLTLSSALLGSALSAVVGPAILGVGLTYSFYKLAEALDVSLADLLQVNQNLAAYFASSTTAQQALNEFVVSGVDSTTNTYDFTTALQKSYANNTLSTRLMREHLTSETDHGVYQFRRTDLSWQRKSLTYMSTWALDPTNCIIGRDVRMTGTSALDSSFFILESFVLQETAIGSSQTLFSFSGEIIDALGNRRSIVQDEIWEMPIGHLMEQINTAEEFLTYIRENTAYEFGAIDVPSNAVARTTA